ncbi:MAG: ABC transporter ATP-binding protein, partial [Chloroflexota bacterium]
MSYLEIENLRVEYERGVPTLDQFNLSVHEGELIALLGPSGCGKTTTLRSVAGFIQPAAGSIRIAGKDYTHLPPNKRDIGMVFQSYALFPHLTVADNVAFGLRMRGVSRQDIRQRVTQALELVGLEAFADRQPPQLSGGQQQRVALARAIVIEPQLLVFDEPLSNLDAKLRVDMRTEIRRLQQRLKITAVYVTHDQVEAMAISDRIVVMNTGRIDQIGTPEEVYSYPKTRFVADFMGFDNAFRVERVRRSGDSIMLEADGQTLQFDSNLTSLNDTLWVYFRPDAATLTTEPQPHSIKGTIVLTTFQGQLVEYVIQTTLGEFIIHQDESKPRHAPG